MRRHWNALSNGGRVGLWLGFLAVLMVGGAGANAALLGVVATSDTASVGVTEVGPAAATPTSTPSRSRTPTPTPTPVIEVGTVLEDVAVPPGAVRVDDPTRDVGISAVTTVGVPGVLTKTWRVTTTDGVETSRELVGEAVTTPPVDEVTSVGTRQPAPPVAPAPLAAPAPGPAPAPAAGGCDPNYSGACVPVAADVDCAGGSGNGPAYVSGPVTVVGSDIYDLDRDGDGIACER